MSVFAADPLARFKATAATRPFFAAVAASALVSTILLIMVGSIVRVTGNGLGCPDWPLCHGRAIPPLITSAWVEFAHRLFGGVVVLQMAMLVLLSWRYYRQDAWFLRTARFAAVVLSFQVVLGGVHVIYELPRWTGWIHTAVAMLVAGSAAVWVSLSWPGMRQLGERTAETIQNSRLSSWTSTAAAGTYLLILTGSLVTRSGAALVCPSFPSCGLATVPDNLGTIVFIQMAHRYTAYAVAFLVIAVLWQLLKASGRQVRLRRFAVALAALFGLQITLGIVNVLDALPMWSRVLHLGTASTIWVLMGMLWATIQHGRRSPTAAEA